MKIVLIRHGLSESNNNRVISGSMDTPLSEKGKQLLYNYRDTVNYPKTDIYISSPLSRCIDTFNILFPNNKIEYIDDNFKEYNFGKMEGRNFDDVNLDSFFISLFNNEQLEDAELFEDFYNRVEKALYKLYVFCNDNNFSSATVICHSTVIKSIYCRINNVPAEESRKVKVINGKGYIIDIDIKDNKIIYNDIEIIGDRID